MASTNPARGMRDFLPADVRKRNYVINIIKEVYESYGFEPLETPSVENLETLMGKYGDEGNQLVFKILKRGEKLQLGSNLKDLADLALRYDLTVPLARVVANNKNELPRFFKRYQIQPVWRADRPARGRFREFYQCDVDCIGSESMLIEAELIKAVVDVLTKLEFKEYVVRVNHRGILDGILELAQINYEDRNVVLTIIDKLDKIGNDGVEKELLKEEIPSPSVGTIMGVLRNRKVFKTTTEDEDTITVTKHYAESSDLMLSQMWLGTLSDNFPDRNLNIPGFANFWSAYDDLQRLLDLTQTLDCKDNIQFDVTLARGLSYYTGTIIELNLLPTSNADFEDLSVSLGGGGRYDGLIGMFGKEQIPACGFSLGLERILVVMEERGMFPPEIAKSTPADIMVTIGNEDTIADSLKLAGEVRKQGLRVTVYPQPDKEDKQWKYANSIGVTWLCGLTESDIADGTVSYQNLKTREKGQSSRQSLAELLLAAGTSSKR